MLDACPSISATSGRSWWWPRRATSAAPRGACSSPSPRCRGRCSSSSARRDHAAAALGARGRADRGRAARCSIKARRTLEAVEEALAVGRDGEPHGAAGAGAADGGPPRRLVRALPGLHRPLPRRRGGGAPGACPSSLQRQVVAGRAGRRAGAGAGPAPVAELRARARRPAVGLDAPPSTRSPGARRSSWPTWTGSAITIVGGAAGGASGFNAGRPRRCSTARAVAPAFVETRGRVPGAGGQRPGLPGHQPAAGLPRRRRGGAAGAGPHAWPYEYVQRAETRPRRRARVRAVRARALRPGRGGAAMPAGHAARLIGIGGRRRRGRSVAAMSPDSKPDTIVLIHGLWMTALSWEHWVERYQETRLQGDRPQLAGHGGRHRRAARGHLGLRRPRRRGDPRALRGHHRRARHAADHHGPLVRRRVHADPARPRPRRGGRRHRLRAGEGHVRAPGLHAEVRPPDPQEPGQPAPGGRADAGGVPLLVHQHADRGGVGADLRALRGARPGPRAVPGRAGELQPARQRGGRLQERRPRAAAADRRRRRPRRARVAEPSRTSSTTRSRRR